MAKGLVKADRAAAGDLAGVRFSVLGSSGYVGRQLVAALKQRGADVTCPPRDAALGERAGHVIFCIGVASDFRTRPFDTVRAHVCALERYLSQPNWDSFTFLSSTRVYAESDLTHEDARLKVRPADPDQLYNASKIAGESLTLTVSQPTARVVRLSNVYGNDRGAGTFLSDVVEQAQRGRILLRTAIDSEKDYVSVNDVISALPLIAIRGSQRVYNVAAGSNVSHGAIVERLRELTGCSIDVIPAAPTIRFAPIDVSRISTEFGWRPQALFDALPNQFLISEKST